MFAPAEYQLLDFGRGRKLEQFGAWTLDRPAPAGQGSVEHDKARWAAADCRFERSAVARIAGAVARGQGPVAERGMWRDRTTLPATWTIRWQQVVFELKRTEFGHLGVFPEHAAAWQWLDGQVRAASWPLRVLNLFAYTGGASLVMAAAGAQVVHVDSARSSVAWARRNADHSGLAGAPIRWIVEDARLFVERELKRGNRYDAVVLDPPTYGHGPDGEAWKLAEHLEPLVHDCLRLTAGAPRFLLLSCHTPGVGRAELAPWFDPLANLGRLSIKPVELISAAGGRLPCGIEARWSCK